MGGKYIRRKYRLFKGGSKKSLFYSFVALVGLLAVFHNSSDVKSYCARKVCSIKQSVDGISDSISGYFKSLSYNFSGESGKTIFRLQNEIYRLKSELEKTNSIQEENQELRSMLKLKSSIKHNIVVAKVYSVFDNDFAKAALLDCGTEQGVQVDDFAFGESGLIGRVIEVGDSWCKVLLIIDANSNIPAKISNVDCMLSGDNSDMLKVSLISGKIFDGAIVETSNYGKVFRGKIKIGTVKKIENDYFVVPYTDFSRLKYVCIDRCRDR